MDRLLKAASLESDPAIASLLDVVCRTSGMGLAIVARVTDDQWIASAVLDRIGTRIIPGVALPQAMMTCLKVGQRGRVLEIADGTGEPVYGYNPLLMDRPFQSYMVTPIELADGSVFGMLCALSDEAVHVDAKMEGTFRLFAGLMADQLEAAGRRTDFAADLRPTTSRFDFGETSRQDAETQLAVSPASLEAINSRVAALDAALLDAQATGLLREQFVAVLGHDLRNPISAIAAGLRLLQRQPLDDRGRQVLALMKQSTERMSELVRNMLDFALIQLGGGIPVNRATTSDLTSTLCHVVEELRAKFPDRVVTTQLDLDVPIKCDPDRVGQLLSNLLANAMAHGAVDRPVDVTGEVRDGIFELAVSNGGVQIPADVMGGLFKPFVRGNGQSREGLGLGLNIAAGIAHAHGGTLTATSNSERTRFVLRMANDLEP